MDAPAHTLLNHTPIRTHPKLGRNEILAATKHKKGRRPNTPGYIVGSLPQGVERAYLVLHPGESIPAVYLAQEFEYEPAFWRSTHAEHQAPYVKEVATYEEARSWAADVLDRVGVEATVEGPFYESKEQLYEGSRDAKDLFDHLANDEDEI